MWIFLLVSFLASEPSRRLSISPVTDNFPATRRASCNLSDPASIVLPKWANPGPEREKAEMAGAYDPTQYETVAERLQRAHADHEDLRIITRILEIVRDENQRPLQYIVEASVYYGDVLKAVDVAEEMVGNGFINKSNALENASTSASGRALSLAGYMGTDPNTKKPVRPTQQDMEKAQRVEARNAQPKPQPAAKSPAPKKQYEVADMAFATALMVQAKALESTEDLKAIYEDNIDLLDCPVDGMTLRDHILQRKAELDAK